MWNRENEHASTSRPIWFDAFAQAAAQGKVSRRTIIGGFVGLFGVMTSGVVRSQPAPVTAARPLRPGHCQRADRTGLIREEALVADGDLMLRSVREATAGEKPRSKLTRTVSIGNRLVYELEVDTRSETDFSATLRLGADITGAKTATLKGLADGSVRGEVDGRLFGSEAARTSIRDARFADGRPPPRMTYPARLKASGPKLAAAEAHARSGCAAIDVRLAPQTTPQPVRAFSGTTADEAVTRDKSPSNWSPPLSHESPACDRCYDRCGDRYVDCVEGDIWDIIEDIGTAGGKVAYCLARWGACMTNCRLPGQGCCPVLCGDVFSGSCCADGKHCLGTYGCCEAGQVVCRSSCCNPGVTHCGADGYCGCPDPYRECGANDCFDPSHQVCCEGSVCPPGSICHNGGCCRGLVCADGSCCDSFGATCCSGTCCYGQCINGICCPQERICGSACCAQGQDCLDRNRSLCGTLASADCGPARLSLRRPCRSSLGDGRLVSTCCEFDCCNGQCCGVGEICCWYNNRCQPSTYVCGPN